MRVVGRLAKLERCVQPWPAPEPHVAWIEIRESLRAVIAELEDEARHHRRLQVLLEDLGAPRAATTRPDTLLRAALAPHDLESLAGAFLPTVAEARAELRAARHQAFAEGGSLAAFVRDHGPMYRRLHALALERVARWGAAFDPSRATLGELRARYVLPVLAELTLPAADAHRWLDAPYHEPLIRAARPNHEGEIPRRHWGAVDAEASLGALSAILAEAQETDTGRGLGAGALVAMLRDGDLVAEMMGGPELDPT